MTAGIPPAPFEEKRYWGSYQAIVWDNNDPQQIGRVRLLVPEVFGNDFITDWARSKAGMVGSDNTPQLAETRGDKGTFFIPDIGDGVWCEFEAGQPDRPLWSGVWWSSPNGDPDSPTLARGEEDETVQSVNAHFATKDDTYAAVYPFDRVYKTKAGHVIEIDDTGGKERIKVFHKSGTFFDIDADGNMRVKVVGNVYQEIKGDLLQQVDGNWRVHVNGEIERVSGTHIQDTAPRIDHN